MQRCAKPAKKTFTRIVEKVKTDRENNTWAIYPCTHIHMGHIPTKLATELMARAESAPIWSWSLGGVGHTHTSAVCMCVTQTHIHKRTHTHTQRTHRHK